MLSEQELRDILLDVYEAELPLNDALDKILSDRAELLAKLKASREVCCKAVCDYCKNGVPITPKSDGPYHSCIVDGLLSEIWCRAWEIRKLMEESDA